MLKGIPAIAAIAAALMAAATAQATTLPIEGGPGGAPFTASCPSGQYLVGFAVRAGAWIDAVAPLCAPYQSAAHTFGKVQTLGLHGGSGGAPKQASCLNTQGITSLAMGFTRDGGQRKFVDNIAFGCDGRDGAGANRCITSGTSKCEFFNESSSPIGPYVGPAWQDCPAGEVATGIRGRSGSSVDALGLFCGPAPWKVTMGTAKPQKQSPESKIIQGGGTIRGHGRSQP